MKVQFKAADFKKCLFNFYNRFEHQKTASYSFEKKIKNFKGTKFFSF